MPIEVYSYDRDCNILSKSLLLNELAIIQGMPILHISIITNTVFLQLDGGDYSILGIWFNDKHPEELVFTLIEKDVIGISRKCWLYQDYDKDFIRLKVCKIFYKISDIPCIIEDL
jgi:hypothetical protein